MTHRIKEIRKQRGMSQLELAEKAEMSRCALAKIENRKTVNMSAYTAIKIAQALGVSLDYLFCIDC